MAFLPIFILLLLISFCKSDDQLTHEKPLYPGDVLVSNSSVFALGFFSPTNSNRSLYLGIWYHNIPGSTVVWIANRNSPITRRSSATLAVTNSSDLVLSESEGRTLWMTTNNITTGGMARVAAVLLDSGNLVVRLPNGTDIWQSFDHPTDTVLPGMRFLMSYKGSIVGRLIAWKGPDDPSVGDFSVSLDPSSNLQLITWHGTKPHYRIGVLNGVTVSGIMYPSNTSSVIYQRVANTRDESFDYMYTVSDDSLPVHITLDYMGTLRTLIWDNHSSLWTIISQRPASSYHLYASCGPFGYAGFEGAVPRCRCLDGFEPNGLNYSMGCRRMEELRCNKQSHFVAMPGMKVPDRFFHIRNRSFDQCTAECINNCSCTAYAYANMSNGGTIADPSRCLVWTEGLVDTEKFVRDSDGETLYLRIADSPVHKKSKLIEIILPVIACLLLLTCISLAWMCKYIEKQRKKEIQKRLMQGYLSTSNGLESENVEPLFVSFEDILAATDTFSCSNLLGMGGFGKVYKGILEGGKEVAVKRLSKDSGQGVEEFKNEVVLIAKLQHKNLVRLYGCCIHEDEKLLIYEYLPNKSLDAFLFENVRRKHVLEWSTRFKIIKGIARGLLYLHQDSRLTIIHRDLKASNVLLDMEMTPKISDFGLARIFGGSQQQANTARVVGTYGYMSPEYVLHGAYSVKTDIYSFGVLLLEIVSGLKISSPQLKQNFPSLTAYAWILWKDGKSTELVDSSIVESYQLHEVIRCIHAGLLCVQNHPDDRPLLSSVVFMLENESALLPAPKHPAYFSPINCGSYETSVARNMENSLNLISITTLEAR